VPTVDPISLDSRGGVDPEEGKAFAAYLDTIDLAEPLVLAVVDGNLISGQNPQSSVETAGEVLRALKA
jgi:putative intracellular protease/amidase